MYDVVLFPTFTQVEAYRKCHARERQGGLFAQTVTTFNAWIADLWELYGDSRAIVDSLQRQAIMHAAFDQLSAGEGVLRTCGGFGGAVGNSEGDLTVSAGVVDLAARCMREGAGVPAFESALDQARSSLCPDSLSLRETALLQGMDCYRSLLFSARLIELGQAAALLARRGSAMFPKGIRVLWAHCAPVSWQAAHFFECCDGVTLDIGLESQDVGPHRLDQSVELRFGFPSGRYAQAALVADLVRDFSGIKNRSAHVPARSSSGCEGEGSMTGAGNQPDCVVACVDPASLFRQVEPELVKCGFRVCQLAQVPFFATDFGRAYLSLCDHAYEGAGAKESLSDALAPPFSGFSQSDCLQADRGMRADRLAKREGLLQKFRAISDTFSQLEELTEDADADVLIGVFEQIALAEPGRSPSWRSEQLAAASALRACMSSVRRVGASVRICRRVLENTMVNVSCESSSGSVALCGTVVITTQAVAAQMGAGSCGQLILADLTSLDYPIADKDDAASILFGKLGLTAPESMLHRARRTFGSLCDLPCQRLACLRPLNDWDGSATYPSAMLQELIDEYRCDLDGLDDDDDIFALPGSLMTGVLQRGEELLYANAQAKEAGACQPCEQAVTLDGIGDVSDSGRRLVALPRRSPEKRIIAGFSPSPSRVESYLDCPFKWFVQSRIKTESLDEGFGPLERGSFSHAVLHDFYLSFQGRYKPKVDASSLADAKTLMAQVAREKAAAQVELPPGGGRLVPVNPMERRELDELIDQLVSFLDYETEFLPGYHPAYFEHSFKLEDGIQYAGRPFEGTVDRIDVDDRGNAVIVDYKGSLSSAYELSGSTREALGMVQTLIYAQVVQRALGLNVVGALYISYGKSRGCAGAYDGGVLESAHLPAMRHDRCRCAVEAPENQPDDLIALPFQDVLNVVEQSVEQAVYSMERGNVQPRPARAEACVYCPVRFCPKRGA